VKLLIFAHTPPPLHGQSYMVQQLLAGLRRRVEAGNAFPVRSIVHVNARVSSHAGQIGKMSPLKFFLLLKYCVVAIWQRLKGSTDTLYYVPAPAKRSALYRDWTDMLFCRPFYPTVLLHWHGVGLGEWLDREAKGWEKWITLLLLGGADLSIVLSDFARADAARVQPVSIAVVPNGIPDPCPDFESTILPRRRQRQAARAPLRSGSPSAPLRALFLASCTREKGLFVSVEAIALVASQHPALGIHLTVAGGFVTETEQREFHAYLDSRRLREVVSYAGFVADAEKTLLLSESDILLFPSVYAHEGQPVSIIEALASGLPVIATRWRGIPELLEGTDAQLIEGQDPVALAGAIRLAAGADIDSRGRQRFIDRYSVESHLDSFIEAALIGCRPSK